MSVTKRQREQAKRDKQAKKAEKKAERLKNPQGEGVDSDIDDSFIGGEPETAVQP